MSLPTPAKTWVHSANNRYTFATVQGAMGALMFSLTQFLITTMGYTCKGSCDGVTGAMDGVNRISAANKWATRNNGAAGAMSWIVITDGAGVDWAFSYNSASDDIVRLAHSTGSNYVAAGTPAQQPTATDECFDAASGSWVNATASADRVWHMSASTDKKMWRLVVCRSAALVAFIAGEQFTSALVAPSTLALSTGGGTAAAIKSFYTGSTGTNQINIAYAAASAGDLARVHTAGGGDINVKATFGGEQPGAGLGYGGGSFSPLNTEKPALQGGTGEMLFPAQLGSTLANADGKLGSKIDHWYAITASNIIPALGDTFGSLQFVSWWPGFVLPWDGVSTPVTT